MTDQTDKTQLLKQAFQAGLDAVMPQHFMADICRKTSQIAQIGHIAQGKKCHLLAFGKAAGAMAQGFFKEGGQVQSGLVIVPEGVDCTHGVHLPDFVQIIHASHPVPNANSVKAAEAALSLAKRLGEGDLLIVLISGGGSSLMSKGLGTIGLADKKALNEALLASGMPIGDMNIIRKHLSAVKGGRLALAAYPASVMSFALSDVPGDVPAAIASGPTCADDSDRAQANALVSRYQLQLPASVSEMLADEACETPFSKDPRLANVQFEVVASAAIALKAAAQIVEQAGYQPVILGDDLEEEAGALADMMVAKLATLPDGTALISGGEASVIVPEKAGVGGRNAQFALEMVRRDLDNICGISCDSDGIDGAKAVAGALFYAGMKDKALSLGHDPEIYHQNCDSHSFFAAMGTDIITGPTQTNVNDVRIILKGSPRGSEKALSIAKVIS